MALAGPRLDRPSAVGDEGRPRATSLTIASIAFVAAAGALGSVTGDPGSAIGILSLPAFVVAGVGLLQRERFVDRFLGGMLGGLGSLYVAAIVAGATLATPAYGLLIVGVVAGVLGLGTAWANVGDAESGKTALLGVGGCYLAAVVWVVVAGVIVAVAAAGWALATSGPTRATPAATAFGFLLAVAIVAGLVRLALGWLPIRELTPVDRREGVGRRLDRVETVVAAIGVAAFALALVTPVAAAVGLLDPLFAAAPGLRGAALGLGSPYVLAGLGAVGGVAMLAGGAAWALRRVTAPRGESATRTHAALATGLFLALAVPASVAVVSPWALALTLLASLVLIVVGGFVVVAVGFCLLAASSMGLLPDRAGGPALASAGLAAATIGAGLLGFPGYAVFTCAAAAMVVWDVSTFGLGVTAEIGHLPETRRQELFHGVIAVGVGAVAVLALVAVDLNRALLRGPRPNFAAGVAAVAGVVVLALALRG